MPISLPLDVRKWGNEDDEWPDRRITLASSIYAIMISPRMACLDVAENEAQFLADSVNEYAEALPLIYEMKEALKSIEGKDIEQIDKIAQLIERAEKALDVTSFDKLCD